MSKKLYFRYGAMNSSKSANALMVGHNYTSRGLSVFMLKPSIEDRGEEGHICSRVGIKSEATLISPNCDLLSIISTKNDEVNLACVIIDESQFLTKKQVRDLCDVVDVLDIPVICYGIRTDFRGDLFEGSLWLLAWADTLEEIKTICWCESKAIMHMRLKDGIPTFDGEQVFIGEFDSYESVCRKHFNEEMKKNR